MLYQGKPVTTDAYRREVADCLGLANGSNDSTVRQKPSLSVRLARTWAVAVIGLGLVGSVAWTVVLLWITTRLALFML
jgi:hypothetical protein